jgi:hypothetical protein
LNRLKYWQEFFRFQFFFVQARVDNMSARNALMREDVALSGRRCRELEEENKKLAQELEQHILQAKLTSVHFSYF